MTFYFSKIVHAEIIRGSKPITDIKKNNNNLAEIVGT